MINNYFSVKLKTPYSLQFFLVCKLFLQVVMLRTLTKLVVIFILESTNILGKTKNQILACINALMKIKYFFNVKSDCFLSAKKFWIRLKKTCICKLGQTNLNKLMNHLVTALSTYLILFVLSLLLAFTSVVSFQKSVYYCVTVFLMVSFGYRLSYCDALTLLYLTILPM